MTKMYGIPNCDTVRTAKKALDAAGTAYVFHDYKKAGADAARIEGWARTVGMDRLLNKRGTTWRKLDEAEQARAEDLAGAAALMAENPSLIKRPVIEHGEKVLVGFNEAEWTANGLL
ncbi:arsenate reductase [Pacificimonas sp. WHA3]|uniref:Arsenate reductase n=1 Tax=Pacificimonas pallii TaxID=2827236 RepID=A0ABS6SAK5_9SPHN|nr:arsenate reductase [Pacificimonas pallii]MBV7255434.1 arsenate reductase [Pacificimonas pallii]